MDMAEGKYEEDYSRHKKKGHKLYAFVVLVLGIAIILLSFIIFFHIQSVEIDGNEYCSDRQILELIQTDKYSVNSLYVCVRYLLGYGKELPCFEEMKVGMGPPWVLKVKVEEKPIVGFLNTDGQEYAYFDKEGLIVKKDAVYIEGVPYVEGVSVGELKLYEPIESENPKIFAEILEASQELSRYDLAAEKIVCSGGRIYVYVGKVCISLGNHVTADKIAQIPPILEKLDGKEGTLHLENYAEGRETITFDNGEFPEEN